jgi:hypothetical protein
MTSERKLATSRAWKKRNAERVRAYRAVYWQANKEREYKAYRQWCESNPEKVSQLRAADRKKNGAARGRRRKPARNLYEKLRYKTDPSYQIQKRLRASLWQSLRRTEASKALSVVALVGCSIEALREHLENQFLPGMTWCREVEIDHIRPVSSFDLTNLEEQRQCFHWSNLRPMWKAENRKKGSSYTSIESSERALK